MVSSNTYAVLGATGNCGTALIQNLLKSPVARVNAYCRNSAKLLKSMPELQDNKRVTIHAGSLDDVELLSSCMQDCKAVFLCISTNDNVPGYNMGQISATNVVKALQHLRQGKAGRDATTPLPKLVLLSSCNVSEQFSRQIPVVLRWVLHRSASYVYHDLEETEKILRAEGDWLTTIYVKPGALSVDLQRGHAVSTTDQDGPLSYLDLAAGMIEAVDDREGQYDNQDICVVPMNGKASFPAGTPLCILVGLLRHYLPSLHSYLPMDFGPR